jgi:hypothetical protein
MRLPLFDVYLDEEAGDNENAEGLLELLPLVALKRKAGTARAWT